MSDVHGNNAIAVSSGDTPLLDTKKGRLQQVCS